MVKKFLAAEEKIMIKCVRSNHFSQGKLVNEFENKFSKYIGTKYASAVMNGTAALHIALLALGIKEGDEIIVPDATFIATANSVAYTGAKPIFVDVDETYCINPDKIEKAITKNTKAIIPVHIYGNVCDMDKICSIAKKHKLHVIEDCAEAHGAEYYGKKVGNFSSISCFSFYENKIIKTGEGGMCLTNSKKLKDKIDLLRAQGKPKISDLKNGKEFAQKQFYHHILAYNYRMTELQAAIGIAQLEKISEYIKKRKEIAKIYEKGLFSQTKIISSNNNNSNNVKKEGLKYKLKKILICEYAKCIYWFYPIILENEKEQISIMNDFRKKKIILRSFFYPCSMQPFYIGSEKKSSYQKNKKKQNISESERLCKQGILLPTDVSKEEANKILQMLIKHLK